MQLPDRFVSALAAGRCVDRGNDIRHDPSRIFILPGSQVLCRPQRWRQLQLSSRKFDRHKLHFAIVSLRDHLVRFVPAITALEICRRQQDDAERPCRNLLEDLFDPPGSGRDRLVRCAIVEHLLKPLPQCRNAAMPQ